MKQDIGPGWHWLVFSGFREYVNGAVLEDDIFLPPTLNWIGNVAAMRTDETHFYVNIMIPAGEVTDLKVNIDTVGRAMSNALKTLETFRTCSCLVGKPCDLHKPLASSEEPE